MGELTGAQVAHPQPLSREVGGQKYQYRRVNVGDFAAITQYLVDLRKESAVKTPLGLMSADDRSRTIARVISTTPTEDELWDFIRTPMGQRFLLLRCLREHQPQLTEKAFDALLDANGGFNLLGDWAVQLLRESGLLPAREDAQADPLADQASQTPTSSTTPRVFPMNSPESADSTK
jgi:hypothetical protein